MFRALLITAAATLSASAYAQTAAPAKDAPAAPAAAAAASGNFAVVNGKALKTAELDKFIRQIKKPDSPELRAQVKDYLINRELLSQEAKKRKIADREDVKFAVENAGADIVVQALVEDELGSKKPSDEQVKAEYDRQVSLVGEKEYKAHHILVETEAQAKDIIARLDKGEKFEDLAKGTKDVGSAANGGELDWAPPAAYVKPFSDAMTKLEKGKYTATPVKSDFGYHVIRLDDVRAMQPPPLEQVKPTILKGLQQQQMKDFIDSLKKKATIK